MSGKRYVKIFGILLCLVFIFSSASLCFAKSAKITTISAWPKTVFETQQFLMYLDMLQKAVEEKAAGQLTIDYKGASEVIATNEQMEALRGGLIDMVYNAPSYYVSVMPEMDLMSLTRMTPWEERKAGVFDYLEELHNKKMNAHFLGHMGTGKDNLFYIFLNKPVTKVEDFKGLKIRVSPTHVPFIKALGAEPIAMPPTDIYTAIERGVVDGFVQPIAPVRDFGLAEVTKYMVKPGFYIPTAVATVNLDAWNKLPQNLKDLMTSVMEEAEHTCIDNYITHNEEVLKYFDEKGMETIELSPEEAKKFSDIAEKSLYDTVTQKAGDDGKKLYEMITK